MGYSRYVGRVGASAVALGVGVAVASAPGVAWADDSTTARGSSAPGTPAYGTVTIAPDGTFAVAVTDEDGNQVTTTID